MALLGETFVTDDEQGMELIPEGTIVTLLIKESDIKTTRAGTGEYIKITAEVLDDGMEGKFNGSKIWHNFNTINQNEMATKIGRGQLKKLLTILNITELKDTAELHGEPFRAVIGIQKGKDGYDDQNTIKKFLPLSEEASSDESTEDAPW